MESLSFARFAAGRKSGAYISRGKFVARLAEHFGLLTVATGLERQPDATAGAHEVAQNAPIVDEGSQADPTPIQAPPPPLAIARTTPQRMARLEEDICEIRGALAEQREVIDVMAHDFSRFSTWAVIGLTRMMERVGVSYVLYSKTHVPYQRRRVKQRTSEASTFVAQIKPGSKFSTIVHEYDAEPSRIFTLNARMGKRDDFKYVQDEYKSNLKTLL
ncbi:hypothetical protein Tco_0967549 [Tanacetum coccineum]